MPKGILNHLATGKAVDSVQIVALANSVKFNQSCVITSHSFVLP